MNRLLRTGLALATGACLAFVACQGPVATPAPDPAPDPPAAVATAHPDPAQPKAPAPLPDPEPAPVVEAPDLYDYRIESLTAEITHERSFGHDAQFTARITNHGGVDGPMPIPISARLDGEVVELDQTIENPVAGDVIEIVHQHRLGAGSHQFELAVGSERRSVDIHVAAVDIVISAGDYRVTAPGQVALPVKVSNLGDAPARHLDILGSWTLVPPGYVSRSSDRYLVRELVPGAVEEFDLEFEVLRGTSRFQVFTEQPVLDRDLTNNLYEKQAFILYDWLSLDVAGPAIYYANGQAFAQFRFAVENQGVEHSPQVWAGFIERSALDGLEDFPAVIADLPRCDGQLTAQCWWGSETLSVRAGRQHTLNVNLPLDVGEHSLVAFVGGPHYGFQWGEDNIAPVQTRVNPQPARAFSGTLRPSIQGYFSDGQAGIRVAATVANWGSEPVAGPLPAQLLCRLPGEDTPTCRQEIEIDLRDGFGPAEVGFNVRTSMGNRLELELLLAGERAAAAALTVPAKILGVDRGIWECYSERGWLSGPPEWKEPCSGMFNTVVNKWDQSEPVKIWVTGRADYRPSLHEAVDEFFPLFGLTPEYVQSEAEADLRAYVGVPKSMGEEIGLNCIDALGCADWDTDENGRTYAGRFVVWSFEERDPTHATGHELLHVMFPIGHPSTPGMGTGGAYIPLGYKAMLVLNVHPLVKPGMTMAQVRELVVLSDELLDPHGPDVYEMVWRAGKALYDADSYRFRVRYRTCGSDQFSEWGTLERRESSFDIRWDGGETDRAALSDGTVWRWSGGGWQEEPYTGYEGEKHWWIRGAAWGALASPTFAGTPETLAVTERGDGRITIATATGFLGNRIRSAELTLDEDTLQLLEYRVLMGWPGECQVEVEALDGEYGIELELPSPSPGD